MPLSSLVRLALLRQTPAPVTKQSIPESSLVVSTMLVPATFGEWQLPQPRKVTRYSPRASALPAGNCPASLAAGPSPAVGPSPAAGPSAVGASAAGASI